MRHRAAYRPAALAAVLVMGLATLSACADEDRGKDAESLRDDVAKMAGVSGADLDYTAPVTLDSGKLQLDVSMDDDATADQVVAVGRTVYAAFHDTHSGEEADVDVRRADDHVHLRSFEPEASVDDVAAEWKVAAGAGDDGALDADINTQDVGGDHVESTLVLGLGDGTGADDVETRLADLEKAYGDAPRRGWGVTAADGSGLRSEPGFPGDAASAAWKDLRDVVAGLVEGVASAVDLREVAGRRDAPPIRTVEVSIGGQGTTVDLADPVTRAKLVDVANQQAALLRDTTESYTWSLKVDGKEVARIDPGLCVAGEGDLGDLDREIHTELNCPADEAG